VKKGLKENLIYPWKPIFCLYLFPKRLQIYRFWF